MQHGIFIMYNDDFARRQAAAEATAKRKVIIISTKKTYSLAFLPSQNAIVP